MDWLNLFTDEPSAGAARVDFLFWSLVTITGAVAVVIFVLTAVFLYRYRAQAPADRTRPPMDARRRTEYRFMAYAIIGIAVAKTVLVMLFFMHLLRAGHLVRLVALIGFLWLVLLIVLTVADFLTRHVPQVNW